MPDTAPITIARFAIVSVPLADRPDSLAKHCGLIRKIAQDGPASVTVHGNEFGQRSG